MDKNFEFYCQPESGWYFEDHGRSLYAKNFLNGYNFQFDSTPAELLRESLTKSNHENKYLKKLSKFDLPGLTDLIDSLRSKPVKHNPAVKSLLGLSDPERLWIEVQGECNERCIHCYAESGPMDLPSLEPELVNKLIDEANQLNFDRIQFTGGDPLIWDELPRMVQKTRDYGIHPEIYTNGLGLTEELFNSLVESNPQFSFSFYSHDPETHNSITQTEGSWKRTLEAIKMVLESDLSCRVAIIEMEENSNTTQETVDFLQEIGLNPAQISKGSILSVGRGDSRNEKSSDSGSRKSSRQQESRSSHDSSKTDTGIDRRDLNPGKLCVSYTGKVYPCIFQRNSSLGSVRERPLNKIIDSPELELVNSDSGDQNELSDKLSCGICRFQQTVIRNKLS